MTGRMVLGSFPSAPEKKKVGGLNCARKKEGDPFPPSPSPPPQNVIISDEEPSPPSTLQMGKKRSFVNGIRYDALGRALLFSPPFFEVVLVLVVLVTDVSHHMQH